MRRIRVDRKGVSHLIGFVLIFSLCVMLLVATLSILDSLVETKKNEVAREVALEVANRVCDAIVEAVTSARVLEDSNYTKIVELPSMEGMDYYIELSNGKVYVNTTDGRISVDKNVYGIEELGFLLKGKVYGSAGRVRISINATQPFLSVDFGTPSSFERGDSPVPTNDYSPVEPGWFRVSNLTKIFHGCGGYWPKYKLGGKEILFLYRVPIGIDNRNYTYGSGSVTSTIPSQDLSDYSALVCLPPSFPYHLVDKTGEGEPRIIFWEVNVTGTVDEVMDNNEIRPYYIETWKDDPPGVSMIWVKLKNVKKYTGEIIYLCFGPVWNSTKEPIDDENFSKILPSTGPDAVFSYFEDFDIEKYTGTSCGLAFYPPNPHLPRSSYNYSFYKIYSGTRTPLTFIRLPYPSFLIGGKAGGAAVGFQEIMEEPSDPEDPEKGKYTENSTVYVLEARIRFHGEDVAKGEFVTNVDPGYGLEHKPAWFGGLAGNTKIYLGGGNTKQISLFSGGEAVKVVRMEDNLMESEIVDCTVSLKTHSGTVSGYKISAGGEQIMCCINQSLCRLNQTTSSWEWVPARKIKVGDKVCMINPSTDRLEWKTVTAIIPCSLFGCYHLTSSYGNFFANRFLVHSYFALGKIDYYQQSGTLRFGYDVAGQAETEDLPKLGIYKNLYYGYGVELMGEDYSYQATHHISKDTWYVVCLSVLNSKVKDWRNTSWSNYYQWNYTALKAWLYRDKLGGTLTTYTPTGVDTSIQNETDPDGEPYLGGSAIGIGCGFIDVLNNEELSSSLPYFDVDWVRLRKSAKVPPRITVGAPEFYMMGWDDTTDIEAYDRGAPNALYQDFNNATHKKTFCFYVKGGNYTITVYMGDREPKFVLPGGANYNHTIYIYQQRNNKFIKVAGPIKILPDHKMDQIVFMASLPNDGAFHFLNITFSAVELNENGAEVGSPDPNARTWVVNGIEIERGSRCIRMGYV